MASVNYTIFPVQPNAHLYLVRCQILAPALRGQILRMPNWIPGSYMIRDFARHITTIRAYCRGVEVSLTKLDKCRWQAPPNCAELMVEYTVYAWDLSVRTAHLDASHGYFNGSSVFLVVEGCEQVPCTLQIQAPTHAGGATWKVATSMPAQEVDARGFGKYCSTGYFDLIDHPVEMSDFARHGFKACGVEHELILTGRYRTDAARLCADLSKICTQHIQLFGEPAPFDRYLFLVMVVDDGYGGLEHRYSTSLLVSRKTLPVPGTTEISDDYLQFLGLCSHEYFHAWNVTRIRPRALALADLDREVHTPLLWAFEGITSYYDDLALVRSGLISAERYTRVLAKTISRVAQNPGRRLQSVGDSSFDAWTKFYLQGENAPNAIVSYYAKGSLVALALDLQLRRSSAGAHSLDDFMRTLWCRYGRGTAAEQGLVEADIEKLASDLAACDLSDFFDRFVRGVEELPLATLLPEVGVALSWRALEGERSENEDASAEEGGCSDASPSESPCVAMAGRTPYSQGLRLAPSDGFSRVRQVLAESASECAGLAAEDLLLAVDGLRIRPDNFADIVGRYSVGEQVELSVFRRDQLLQLALRLAPPARDCAILNVTCEESARHWLGGT